jgi:hypothetical protein
MGQSQRRQKPMPKRNQPQRLLLLSPNQRLQVAVHRWIRFVRLPALLRLHPLLVVVRLWIRFVPLELNRPLHQPPLPVVHRSTKSERPLQSPPRLQHPKLLFLRRPRQWPKNLPSQRLQNRQPQPADPRSIAFARQVLRRKNSGNRLLSTGLMRLLMMPLQYFGNLFCNGS